MRFFVAGFQHETNTFAEGVADWSAFERGDFFPPVSRGEEMLSRLEGSGLPLSGFIQAARADGHVLAPSCWAGASPSGPVTREAFARITSMIETDLRLALRDGLDGVYLDLHGAAVCEDPLSADADLAQRVRAIVGPDAPLVVSLDLHANVDPSLIDAADYVTAYRTYPHTDMKETGVRALRLLQRRIRMGRREPAIYSRIPFLIPIIAQNTLRGPAKGVYDQLAELERTTGAQLEFCTGFPAADVPHCGPALWGYGDQAAEAIVRLSGQILALGAAWRPALRVADAAVQGALSLAATADGPVIIADVQDNPGAGGGSDTTGLIHALLAHGAGQRFPGRVAVGLIADPDAVLAATRAGVGQTITLSIGKAVRTWSGQRSEPPVVGQAKVLFAGQGSAVLEGPMMTGSAIDAGPCACVEMDGVLIALSSARTQMLDRVLFRMVGIAPEDMKVLVNKSAVHFHADFDQISSNVIYAKANGPMAADPADLPWRRLAKGVALSSVS